MNAFWTAIDELCNRLEKAKTAAEVVAILNDYHEPSVGDAFFEGSGGDRSVREALDEAGWTVVWSEASYHYAMRAPDGSLLTYVEGDVYLGDRHV